MRLGVDPRKADQMVRGTVNLPHGTGKTARVLVFANAEKADAAREAGADVVGGDELIEKVNGGWLEFDAVVATPDMMGKVGRLGRVLGPRGLMPNPKTGTVTPDVAKAVSDIKGGKIEFRVDRHANLHFIIGKASFSEAQLAENYAAALEEVLRLKPASSKGRYIRKVTVSTTMGPGVQVDPNRTRNVTLEDDAAAAAAAQAEPTALRRDPRRSSLSSPAISTSSTGVVVRLASRSSVLTCDPDSNFARTRGLHAPRFVDRARDTPVALRSVVSRCTTQPRSSARISPGPSRRGAPRPGARRRWRRRCRSGPAGTSCGTRCRDRLTPWRFFSNVTTVHSRMRSRPLTS